MQPTVIEHTTAGPLPEPSPAFNPLSIIDKAVERGATPESLQKLLDLVKDWTAFQAQQQFNNAMAACQAEMPTVVRDSYNPGTRSRYAPLETVADAIKPCYTRHGFYLSFSTEDCPLAEHVRIVCEVGHKAGDTRSRRYDIPLDGKGAKGQANAMNAPQAQGSTFSYGCRYATLLTFNVTVADRDKDGVSPFDFISLEQCQEIDRLLIETKADRKRFLAWAEAESLDKIRVSDFEKVIKELKRKQKNGGAKP